VKTKGRKENLRKEGLEFISILTQGEADFAETGLTGLTGYEATSISYKSCKSFPEI